MLNHEGHEYVSGFVVASVTATFRTASLMVRAEGGREGGRKGGREGGREGGRKR